MDRLEKTIGKVSGSITKLEESVVLPRENPLAIEYLPENMTSITEPANQSSVDAKKGMQIIRFIFGGAKNILMSIDKLSTTLISKINPWFCPK